MNHRRAGMLRCALGIALALIAAVSALCASGDDRLLLKAVEFSRPSGFYDEEFYLELKAGLNRIYYTLDGSDPDDTAQLYTGPILIEDASANQNVYSMIEDVSVFLNPKLMADNGVKDYYQYVCPTEPVDKATIVRAVSIDELGRRSEITDAVYFVGFQDKGGYDGVNIMAISTDPDNLFGYKRGIYVLGKTFWTRVEDGLYKGNKSHPTTWRANYNQRGREWEREASVVYFDTDRKQVFGGSYGIRIQGRVSRGFIPRSLNLFARQEYGGAAFDGRAIFGVDDTLDSLNLNSGGNDRYTMLTDYIVNELADGMDVALREYEPCALFLDGEYWGLYWLTPKFKEDYLSQKYGVYADNIIAIKNDALEVGHDADEALYREMREYIIENDMGDPRAYESACAMIDIGSCIDYYALEIYIANTDWPTNNYMVWRTRNEENGPYGDGRWRWIVYDVNSAMKKSNAKLDSLKESLDQDAFFASLMENQGFAAAFYDKLGELAKQTFKTKQVKGFVNDYIEAMQAPFGKRIERFFGENRTVEKFIEECNNIRLFFQRRRKYVLDAYVNAQ